MSNGNFIKVDTTSHVSRTFDFTFFLGQNAQNMRRRSCYTGFFLTVIPVFFLMWYHFLKMFTCILKCDIVFFFEMWLFYEPSCPSWLVARSSVGHCFLKKAGKLQFQRSYRSTCCFFSGAGAKTRHWAGWNCWTKPESKIIIASFLFWWPT